MRPADGQMSASMHTSHRGLRACTPGVRARSAAATAAPTPRAPPSRRGRARSSRVGLGREPQPMRQPGHMGVDGQARHPNRTDRTTLPVLRPTPGRVTRSSSSIGTSPPNRSSTACAIPIRLLVFDAEEARRADELLDLVGIGVREVGRRRIPREQRRRDHVDPLVGATAPTGSSPRAARRRCGASARTARRDTAPSAARQPRPRSLGTSGTGHGRRVPSTCDDRDPRPGRTRRFATRATRSRRSTRHVRAVDGHDALGDAVWRDLEAPDADSVGFLIDGARYIHVARQRDAAGWPRTIRMPDARDRATTDDAARRRRSRTSCATAAGQLECWVFGATERRRRRVRRAGLGAARELFEMRVAAPARRDPAWPPGVERAHVRARPRRGRVAARQQPSRSPATPTRAVGPRATLARAAWPSRGSTRSCSSSRSTPTGSPASTG